MKKLFFLYLILIANIICQTPYNIIGNQLISSYGIIKKDKKEEIQSSKTWQPEKVKLSEHERREILFSILNDFQLHQNEPKLNE